MVESKTTGGLPALKNIIMSRDPTYFEAINIVEQYSDSQQIRIPETIQMNNEINQQSTANYSKVEPTTVPQRAPIPILSSTQYQNIHRTNTVVNSPPPMPPNTYGMK